MPTIERVNPNADSHVLKVTISPGEYLPLIQTEMRKLAQKAQVKGFRKGKVPENHLRKLYGPSLILDVVDREIKSELKRHIEENKYRILGEPVLREESPEHAFDLNKPEVMDFLFELGIIPPFEVKGLGENDTYDYFLREVKDEDVEREYQAILKDSAEMVDKETGFTHGDHFKLQLIECISGEETETSLRHETELVSFSSMSESLQSQFKDLSVGDTLTVDCVYDLNPTVDRELFRKYLLGMFEPSQEREVSETFRLVVLGARCKDEPREDEAFFEHTFGQNQVKSREEAHEVVRKHFSGKSTSISDGLLFREIVDRMHQETQVNLPEAFIHDHMLEPSYRSQNGEYTPQMVELVQFLRRDIIWKTSTAMLGVAPTAAQVRDLMTHRVSSHFGINDGDKNPKIQSIVSSMMADKDKVREVFQDLETMFFVYKAKETTKLNEVILSAAAFDEKAKVFQKPKAEETED